MRIKVGPHRYELKSDDETSDYLRAQGERGTHDPEGLTIRVDSALRRTAFASTLLHEVLHAIWHSTSLCEADGVKDHEEMVVSGLTDPLLEVLKENPELLDLLRTEV